MSYRILVVDDDENLLKSLNKILSLQHYSVDAISNPMQVEKLLETNQYHSVLLDVKMPGINGLELLKIIMQKSILTPVIMVSGQSNIEIAMRAIKEGAYDFVEKPIDPDRLLIVLKHALQHQELVEAREKITQELLKNFKMVGKSAALRSISDTIEKIAKTNIKVLITGESGTGKELVAKATHYNSNRQTKRLSEINCAAIPRDLLENELFGHKKGAFSGAISDYDGQFLETNGGTLFLDEIGDMDIHLQAKLLRVLEENEVNVIGDTTPKKVDVRIISATNKDIEQLIKSGKLRKDLMFRLNGIRIHIPPLRERKEDILPLAYHFLKKFNNSYNRQILKINRQAESYLLNYNWPGNVRELMSVMERLVVFIKGNEITIEDIHRVFNNMNISPTAYSDVIPNLENKLADLRTAHEIFEKNYILEVLEQTDWKKSEAAQILGIDRTNLYKKMRKHGII